MEQYTVYSTESTEWQTFGCGNDDMWSNGEWELLNVIVHKDDIIFDVGANKGYWTSAVLSIANPAVIFAFEPVPVNFDELVTKNHFRENVKTFKLALADYIGKSDFYWYSNNTQTAEMSNLFGRPEVEKDQKLKKEKIVADVATIDEVCNRTGINHINLIKADVEGAEAMVIDGAKGLTDKDAVEMIYFEYGGCWKDSKKSFKDVFGQLTEKYNIFRIIPTGLLWFQEWNGEMENYQHQNIFCLRKDSDRLMYEKK